LQKLHRRRFKTQARPSQAVVTAIAAIPVVTLKAFLALKVAQANAAGKPAANLAGSDASIEFKLGRQGI